MAVKINNDNMERSGDKTFQADCMICAMSRLLRDEDTVFTGLASHMPFVAIMLARSLHAPDLWQLNTPGGVNPSPKSLLSYTTIGGNNSEGATSEYPLADCFDLAMRGGLDVAFLGGVQFDRYGGVNASVIGDYNKPKVRLPGGAGSAVYIPTAKKVVIWRTRHDEKTFVEKVDFLTAQGNVDTIVTNLGVLKMWDGELKLQYYYPGICPKVIRQNTGFPLDISKAKEMEAPSQKELIKLRSIDPHGYRYMEIRQSR